MTFVNGDYAVPFDCIAQDHKRAFDNDQTKYWWDGRILPCTPH